MIDLINRYININLINKNKSKCENKSLFEFTRQSTYK